MKQEETRGGGDATTAMLRSKLTWILASALALRVVGLAWGLPGADGWDNDGVAPRDFLVGTAETYWWGHFYTYPPVHLVLLSLLSAPVWLFRAVTAPHLDIQAFIHVPTMTGLALVARVVTLVMSLGLIVTLGKIAEEIAGRTAGLCTAAVAAVNASFVYYSQTTNLDVPYMFWGALAVLELVRLVRFRAPERLRRTLLFAVLAVGTKDQAYALFLVLIPVTLALFLAFDGRPRQQLGRLAGRWGLEAVVAVCLLLVIDGALFNPLGFRDRVHFLLGSASQAHVEYESSWRGRAAVVADVLATFPRYYPLAFAPFALLGMVAAPFAREAPPEENRNWRWALALIPLLAMISFTVAFNMSARRTEHRFVLPQSLFVSIYIGIGVAALLRARAVIARWGGGMAAAVAMASAVYGCLTVDHAMVEDPRYGVEEWLEAHVQKGDGVEIYGNNVYLPRPPKAGRTWRVDRHDRLPRERRSPLPDVLEVEDSFLNVEARKPRFLVLPEAWYGHFLRPVDFETASHGRTFTPFDVAESSDADARSYFEALFAERLHYHLAYVGKHESALFPVVDIHASLDREVRVYERNRDP